MVSIWLFLCFLYYGAMSLPAATFVDVQLLGDPQRDNAKFVSSLADNVGVAPSRLAVTSVSSANVDLGRVMMRLLISEDDALPALNVARRIQAQCRDPNMRVLGCITAAVVPTATPVPPSSSGLSSVMIAVIVLAGTFVCLAVGILVWWCDASVLREDNDDDVASIVRTGSANVYVAAAPLDWVGPMSSLQETLRDANRRNATLTKMAAEQQQTRLESLKRPKVHSWPHRYRSFVREEQREETVMPSVEPSEEVIRDIEQPLVVLREAARQSPPKRSPRCPKKDILSELHDARERQHNILRSLRNVRERAEGL